MNKIMFRVFVSVLLLILGVHSQAQIRQGGEPYNWKEKTTSMFITSFERMPEMFDLFILAIIARSGHLMR